MKLKFGSRIIISFDEKNQKSYLTNNFMAKIDQRGRFVVPISLRKNSVRISGLIKLIVRDSLSGKMEDCGSSEPGSKANTSGCMITRGTLQ